MMIAHMIRRLADFTRLEQVRNSQRHNCLDNDLLFVQCVDGH